MKEIQCDACENEATNHICDPCEAKYDDNNEWLMQRYTELKKEFGMAKKALKQSCWCGGLRPGELCSACLVLQGFDKDENGH